MSCIFADNIPISKQYGPGFLKKVHKMGTGLIIKMLPDNQ